MDEKEVPADKSEEELPFQIKDWIHRQEARTKKNLNLRLRYKSSPQVEQFQRGILAEPN